MAMATVYPFPGQADRKIIRDIIMNFARGKCERIDMVKQIAHILKSYKTKKMSIGECTVSILDYLDDLPIINIEGEQISDLCPGCGAKSAYSRYLRTQEENVRQGIDIITVFCFECGCIFDTEMENGMGTSEGDGGA